MGGCSAPNCSNSTTIGKQLFRFPKDPVRMRKWLVNCHRDFVPTPCSRLCQPSVDSEEDGVQRTDEERPCSLCQHYKIKLEQHQQHTVRLQREAEEMKKRLYKLSKIEKGLQVFLFEDQICALTLAKHSRRAVWSHGTLLTARKIRCAVGVKRYEYLRELGYPLPSYRTLCNRLDPKMMVTTSMQDELAELGLGIITACDSPEGNVMSDEGLIGVMT
ncbi:uncharacterized protein LOC132155417 [Carassius carassius]|uniref:uncharacterized protein LOC132155417 n=1 Tax=Carassius carassius TaxID=217509 RepID=UPI0028693F36|nr:uncharacterized protein LOC132155417 [Carassius carassius]